MTFGLNILGDRGLNNEEVRNKAAAMGANYHLVMNNPELARLVQPTCRRGLIYRKHHNDDNAQDRQDAISFVRERHAEAPPGALLYIGNEPWATEKLAGWTYQAMDECERLGRRGVILNFSTGNPEPIDWQRFHYVLERAYVKKHLLGLHEYEDVDWRKNYPWHVGRLRVPFEIMGSRMPETIITELGACIGYQPLRGYRWASSMSDGKYAGSLVEIAREVYTPRNVSALIFAVTREDPADDWQTFNPTAPVLQTLAAYNQSVIVINTPPSPIADNDGRWTPVYASANGVATNVRSTPKAAGATNKVGLIGKNTPISIILDNTAAIAEGTAFWRPVKLASGVIGWARDDVFTHDLVTWYIRELNVSGTLNIRAAATTTAKVLIALPDGIEIGTSVPETPIYADGYQWARVHTSTIVGWVALVREEWEDQFLVEPPPPPEDQVVLERVPYASQWGYPSERTGLCGPASVWMVAFYDRKLRSIAMPVEITVESIANYIGLGKSDFLNMAQLQTALWAYGVHSEHTRELTVDRIEQEIDLGNPVIVLLDYGHIKQRQDKSFTRGHILVAVGYDDENVIFHDPDYTGAAGNRQKGAGRRRWQRTSNRGARTFNPP